MIGDGVMINTRCQWDILLLAHSVNLTMFRVAHKNLAWRILWQCHCIVPWIIRSLLVMITSVFWCLYNMRLISPYLFLGHPVFIIYWISSIVNKYCIVNWAVDLCNARPLYYYWLIPDIITQIWVLSLIVQLLKVVNILYIITSHLNMVSSPLLAHALISANIRYHASIVYRIFPLIVACAYRRKEIVRLPSHQRSSASSSTKMRSPISINISSSCRVTNLWQPRCVASYASNSE